MSSRRSLPITVLPDVPSVPLSATWSVRRGLFALPGDSSVLCFHFRIDLHNLSSEHALQRLRPRLCLQSAFNGTENAVPNDKPVFPSSANVTTADRDVSNPEYDGIHDTELIHPEISYALGTRDTFRAEIHVCFPCHDTAVLRRVQFTGTELRVYHTEGRGKQATQTLLASFPLGIRHVGVGGNADIL